MNEQNSRLKPSTPLQYLKGVGPKLAQVFQKKAIYTAWDLLFYLPIKYIDRRTVYSIADLPAEKQMTFLAKVEKYSVRKMFRRRRKILEITLVDESGKKANATFFQFNEDYLKRKFPEGSWVLFLGDVKTYRSRKTVVHPDMQLWDEDESEPSQPITPLYSLTEGLYQKTIRRIVKQNLDQLIELIEEEPRAVRETGEVKLSLKEAFRYLHSPPADADIELLDQGKSPYHQRVIYDEFFYLQLGLQTKRYKEGKKSTIQMGNKEDLFQEALKTLPFELTSSQKQAVEEIRQDFLSGCPMNRLLQGDVGSGKTMVAFLSSLFAANENVQVALMAPTEVLAEQHFRKILPYENKLGICVELLTGSTSTKKRNEILSLLKQGRVDILIGTHALITPDVEFPNLGYVIIDEQHRFGVMQRAQLKNKSKFSKENQSPHLLAMTATPIPRTLSMTLYGDLNISVMTEMPKGRQPIHTKVFWERSRQKMYDAVRQELSRGRQAYFIYPLVEESEKMDLKDATQMHQNLQAEFSEFQVGLLHGRMSSAEKDSIMQSFNNHEIDMLVSTTVVEVGVDVPNATVMVIEHAERFGLSQLHQLRGRVGRGEHKSYCFLMAGYARSKESDFRLKIMEETQDGFVIAEEDLRLRGPGQFLGTQQSGLPDFRLAELVRDGHLLNRAKTRASELLETDPDLSQSENQLIKRIMLDRWGKRLDLFLA